MFFVVIIGLYCWLGVYQPSLPSRQSREREGKASFYENVIDCNNVMLKMAIYIPVDTSAFDSYMFLLEQK